MVTMAIWHGTSAESAALQLAVIHNCACQSGRRCGAHSALLEQRWLNGILFARFMREQLLDEEGLPCTKHS